MNKKANEIGLVSPQLRWLIVAMGLGWCYRLASGADPARGSIPLSSTVLMSPRKRLQPLTGHVLGVSQGQGLRPAVILALYSEESKAKNDMPQLSE